MSTITIECHPFGTFTVSQGERTAKEVTYEEILGLISAMTLAEPRRCLQWLKTKEEQHHWDSYLDKLSNREFPGKSPIPVPITAGFRDETVWVSAEEYERLHNYLGTVIITQFGILQVEHVGDTIGVKVKEYVYKIKPR